MVDGDVVKKYKFQSTLPAWGATLTPACLSSPITISIHAPRMGSDVSLRPFYRLPLHFNPRSPHGERQEKDQSEWVTIPFQSTLPAWGATTSLSRYHSAFCISIHAPRMGSDKDNTVSVILTQKFQSTLPAWGATYLYRHGRSNAKFQSTLPAWGATK